VRIYALGGEILSAVERKTNGGRGAGARTDGEGQGTVSGLRSYP